MKSGRQIGNRVPGLTPKSRRDDRRANLAPYWEWDLVVSLARDGGGRIWERTGPVRRDGADLIPDGWRLWLRWDEICRGAGAPTGPGEREMLTADEGRTLGFTQMVARRRAEAS